MDKAFLSGGSRPQQPPRREMSISCMLNAEVGAVLAVIRRPSDLPTSSLSLPDDGGTNPQILNSLKSLRSLLFHPRQWGEWRTTDPSVYLTPFLDVIQSDEVPTAASGIALYSVLKILKLDIFDEHTPGAHDAIHSVVFAITNSRVEQTDGASEDAILMRVLQVITVIMRTRASVLLSDHAVCTIVNTCFQVVQQSAQRSDLLQRSARHTMHELIQAIFVHLPDVHPLTEGPDADDLVAVSSYGARCMIDIFQFLCSLLNVGEIIDMADGTGFISTDEDVQLFALVLINSAVELGGDAIGKHPKLLRIIQDDLFHHLIHYGNRSGPLVLSMICSTVLHFYNLMRRCLRLQLEAFFTYVLLRVTKGSRGAQLQEVAIEGIAGFCQQPNFVIETYVNYDCDPLRRNVFEEMTKVLCRVAYPVTLPMSSMQVQAFEALITIITTIANNIEVDGPPDRSAYNLDVSDYKPFWVEKCDTGENTETWVDFVRMRKMKKKKVMIAANHYNRDDKKGLDFLKLSKLVPTPPDAKSFAYFFRYTPGLDKVHIGDFLGDPDEFNLQVLREFTATFDFSGVNLEAALRGYLETFRLPGESQKIHRIIEAFADRFYEQQTSEIFVSKDAVLILCYSLIMLNTDQHNPQVKRKMTEEEFIRNNREINGGKDLPREYLSELFHSISSNAIVLSGATGSPAEMTSAQWSDLIKAARVAEPFVSCDYKHKLSREAFIAMSGPSVAAITAIFEHVDDEEILHESLEGLISIARIAQYGLEDTLDELLACFCKFTNLLNPYSTLEETLLTFGNEVKPRMATLAFFTIANNFGESVKGAWKNVVECVLKLKRLKLLPPLVIEPDNFFAPDSKALTKCDSGVIFPGSQHGGGGINRPAASGLMGRFSQFLSPDHSESMVNFGSELENNLKIIQQCQIGEIFAKSPKLPDETLNDLCRTIMFAAGGKGHKFSTSIEEDEVVGFCWDLLVAITSANTHRFAAFWPHVHDNFAAVSQFTLLSAGPFVERAIDGLFKIAIRVITSASRLDKTPEELIFKSINLVSKLEKDVHDVYSKMIAEYAMEILDGYSQHLQTSTGWRTLLNFLIIAGRIPETFDRGVDVLIKLMREGRTLSRFSYPFCIEAAFGFAALKISPLEKSSTMLSLMGDSVNLLIRWHKQGFSDPGGGAPEDAQRVGGGGPMSTVVLFMKLVEPLRKTSLVRREELRNRSIGELRKCFAASKELDFTPANCLSCFNLVIFAMVDDLHEKMLEYSQRENSAKEMRSMEASLKLAMELMADVYLQQLLLLAKSPGFRTFWLGLLRRMDTCMKVDLRGHVSVLRAVVPVLLKKMILAMKETGVLVQEEGNELWDITNIQIQWIAPSVKDDLFPDIY